MTNVTGFTETLMNAPKNDFRGAEKEVMVVARHLKTTATALLSLSFFNPICAKCTQTDYDPFTVRSNCESSRCLQSGHPCAAGVASSAALTGTLGVVASGVDPVRYHAYHSQHVTRRLPREGGKRLRISFSNRKLP